MKTMVSGDMIGEGLGSPGDLGIFQRPVQELEQPRVFRVCPARVAGEAVQDPRAAAGGESEITEHYHPPGSLRPPTYAEAYPAEIPTPRMPARKEPKQVFYQPADGFAYLRRALEALQMIRPEDLQKEKAFAKLRQWLNDHE